MAAHSTATNIGALEPAAPRRIAIPFGALRSASRCFGFALVLVLAAVDYVRALCVCRRSESLRQRALWLQRWSRIVLRLIGLELHHHGTPPSSGMIISNHLSYLDILAYSALVPCVFVAKKEVARWPVLGLFARMAGTIFVDRTRRMKVADTNLSIVHALRAGTVVVLFAEGTSSDGRTVLPFRSSLLEPVACSDSTIVPAAISYRLDEGSVSEEVCYWRDMTLLPHLLKLFAKRRVRARIAFGSTQARKMRSERKEAVRQLHEHVSALHAAIEDSSASWQASSSWKASARQCAWRELPHDLPPWDTVYGYFRRWTKEGLWEWIGERLRDQARPQAGKKRPRPRRSSTVRSSKPPAKAARAATTPTRKSKGAKGIS